MQIRDTCTCLNGSSEGRGGGILQIQQYHKDSTRSLLTNGNIRFQSLITPPCGYPDIARGMKSGIFESFIHSTVYRMSFPREIVDADRILIGIRFINTKKFTNRLLNTLAVLEISQHRTILLLNPTGIMLCSFDGMCFNRVLRQQILCKDSC